MSVAIVTGSGGLIGSETVKQLSEKGLKVIGIDADLRQYFFGNEASTQEKQLELSTKYKNYTHIDLDIRDKERLENVFARYGRDISIVVHTASQPSHDWAVKEPITDFDINARATLMLLHFTQKYSKNAYFLHCSTSKVYGDNPNKLPFEELETRYELPKDHLYYNGISEDFSIDNSKHSLFGCSKLAGDIYVQEFGKYFGLKTALFRPGCLTGPSHKGAQLHGFLAYLVKCAVKSIPYTIFGHGGKQVRDNIHAFDFVKALLKVTEKPQYGTVYNFGGGRHSNCSMLEAILILQDLTGKELQITYETTPRIGDHIWFIGSIEKYLKDYPDYKYEYNQNDIINELYETYKGKI